MNEIRAMRMNPEDCALCRVVLGFLATPLVLLLVAGFIQAMSAV